MNLFDGKVVPEPLRVAQMAHYMQGAVTIEWLLANPDWYDMIDVFSIAHSQAEAQRAKDNAPTS